MTSFDFVENCVGQYLYYKVSGWIFIFLILYVNDTLLANSGINLLYEVKQQLSKEFDIKDLDEVCLSFGIEIHKDCSRHL